MATAPAPAEAEHLTPERREMVEHFVSVTGATEEIALQFLESHDWQLENGVHSYMAIIDDGGDRESSNARNRAEDRDSADERWEEHYRVDEDDMVGHDDSISSETAKDTEQPGSGARGPVRREDSGRDESTARSKASRSSSAAIEAALDGLGMERLRNFAAEGYAVPQSAAATADDSMESIFPPPKDLMFLGNFDALRKKAEDEKKYCLVNIQRRDEFPSFELNRDTWKDVRVKELVQSQFVFWQQHFDSAPGQRYLSIYPTFELPTVDIISPMTGALLARFPKYNSPEDMVEKLTRFLDSHEWGTMGKAMSTASQIPFDPSAYHAVDGPNSADKRTRMSLENEDPELDAAIASSLQDSLPPNGCLDEDAGRGVRRQRSDSASLSAYTDSLRVAQEMEFQQALEEDQEKERIREEEEERLALQKALELSEEEERLRVLRSKEASLSSEPGPDEPGVVRLALRFPDGTRKNRCFRGTDTLQTVMDFMHVNGADPEQHTIALSFPRRVLDDPSQTLAALGIDQQTVLNVEAK